MKNTPQFEQLEKLAGDYLIEAHTGVPSEVPSTSPSGIQQDMALKLIATVEALRGNVGDPASQVERIAEILKDYLPAGWDEEGQGEETGHYQGGRVLDMTGDVRIPIYSEESSLHGAPPGTERVAVSLAATVEVEMHLKLEDGESTRGDAKGKVELSQDERWKASVLANGAHAEWTATEARVVPATRIGLADPSDAQHEQI